MTLHRAARGCDPTDVEDQAAPTDHDLRVPADQSRAGRIGPSWKQWASAGSAAGIVALALWVAHARASAGLAITDRILLSSFVVFTSGFAVLLLLFIVMTILGRINLAQALEDKPATSCRGGISLSRLQAFLWTLVILTTYFYQAVTNRGDGLPSVPPDLLMVMGMSSAVYLTSKGMSARAEKER